MLKDCKVLGGAHHDPPPSFQKVTFKFQLGPTPFELGDPLPSQKYRQIPPAIYLYHLGSISYRRVGFGGDVSILQKTRFFPKTKFRVQDFGSTVVFLGDVARNCLV